MRTLLISGSYFPPQIGGISTLMAEVCAELGERQVAVLTGVPGEVDHERLRGVRLYRASGCFPPHKGGQVARLLAALARAIAVERPNLLQFASIEDAYIAYWTHRVFGLKHVFYAHGNEILDIMRSDWNKPRLALKSAAAVIACSRHTAGLVSMMGLLPDRIRVVHPGCDVDRFKRTFVNEETRARLTRGRPGARILLTVGNLVERKGHDMVIRALSRLRAGRPDVLYVIAGDGPHRATLEQLAVSMGVADRVIFLGRVPPSDLPLLYSMADIFLMVSRERLENCDLEGFGIVFIEAAACGAPAIGGRSGGIEDAVVDNVTGLLVDPLSIEDVAASIDRLLSDKALADQLGEAAMRRAIREFSWSRYGREIRAILEEVNRSQS